MLHCVIASLQLIHSISQTRFLILQKGRKVEFSQGEVWGGCTLLSAALGLEDIAWEESVEVPR